MAVIIPVFIPHVGCPHDCVFCNQKKIAGKTSAPTGAEVKEIIKEALSHSGENPEAAFYGGSFTAIERGHMIEYLAAAKHFADRGEISGLRLSTRPDAIDEEILCVLREYGVKTIELGAQSMNDEVLKASGRGHTAEDVRNASRLIKQYGFSLILQMMTHLPASNNEKDIKTAGEIASLNPDGVRIYPTVVVRDTALEVLWRAGKYTPATPEEAAELGAELLDVFDGKSIPVIRFGLNPTDDLSEGEALAGAYHPALGEMARSAQMLCRCVEQIDKKQIFGGEIVIYVNPRKVSTLIGQKKKNKAFLAEKYGFTEITVVGNASASDNEVEIVRK